MHPIIRPAMVTAATIALTACANPYKIEAAKQVSPQGEPFTQSLARNYSDLTRFESEEMYDWSDATHYAEKTLLAAEGRRVAPEDPRDWDIDNEEWRADLLVAHDALMSAYEGGAARTTRWSRRPHSPNYDCWVEQSAEGWQMDDIAACREGFMNAMNQLGEQPQPAMREQAPCWSSLILMWPRCRRKQGRFWMP